MGTDIHAAVEYRTAKNQPWQVAQFPNKYFGSSWHSKKDEEFTNECDFNRDYDLFAILGNVRNGRGFAGIVTGAGYEPMTDSRGVPDDISDDAREVLSDEHSATWVSLAEILAYDWDRYTTHQGVVSAAEFADWDIMKDFNSGPSSWSGDVSGRNVVHISPEAMRVKVAQAAGTHHHRSPEGQAAIRKALPDTYTKITWRETYSEGGKQLWTLALPKMLNLGREHGFDNVRLVMDFDS